MLDMITKNVGRITEQVRKGVIPKKMKVVLVQDPETVYIVQTRYFDQYRIKRPGRRIMMETEQAAAERLVSLVVKKTLQVADVVVVDSKGSGTNQVTYVFWFAPEQYDISVQPQIRGYVLPLKEQLSLEHEFVLRAEARIAADLLAKAIEQRSVILDVAA